MVARHVRSETVCRLSLNELMFSPRSRLLSEHLVVESADDSEESAFRWSAAPESERAKARERAAHVREALTGYQSGTPISPRPGEPRAPYRQHLPKGNRLAAKANEIGVTLRTFARWVSRYEKGGEVELLSAKALQSARISERFELFEQVALDVMREHTDLSRPSREYVIAHTRARLVGTYGPGAVPLPSRATAYRILEKLEVRHPLFSKSTKRNRDIAARPVLPYGKLRPARPGEYLLMDTTCLDVFAMDPHSLRWVGVQGYYTV